MAVTAPLKEEFKALQAFVGLLRREQALLTEGDVDALPPLLAEKSALVDRLNRMPPSREAAFLSLAAEARALNETNGKLIALHMQRTQKALSVLMAAADRGMTYGPDGQQQVGGGGRSFGSA